MRVASAVRGGDEYSPVVLIVVGGAPDGAIAAVPAMVLGSQG